MLAVGAGVLLFTGACGDGQTSQNQPAAEPPLTIAPPTGPTTGPGVPPADAMAVPGTQLDFSAVQEGYPKQAWTVGDGRIIAIQAQEGGCGKASAEITEQSAAKVLVTLVETQPSEPVACTMDIRYPIVSVTLDTPLANRTVVLRAEQRRK